MCLSEESTSFLSSGGFSLSRSAYISPLRIFRYSVRECDADAASWVRFVRFRGYWLLRRALLDSGACRRERERKRGFIVIHVGCAANAVQLVHFSCFLCFARAFRLDCRRGGSTIYLVQRAGGYVVLENIAKKVFIVFQDRSLPRGRHSRAWEKERDVIFLQHWGNTERGCT